MYGQKLVLTLFLFVNRPCNKKCCLLNDLWRCLISQITILMRRLIFLPFVFLTFTSHAQNVASKEVLSVNAQIDEAVVKKNTAVLEKYYADDFVFTHGTGFVEGKESWIKNVANPDTQFISRIQDSTTVELHNDVALVIGKIEITRKDKDKHVAYGLWYVRVYRKDKDVWQMISHRTTHEWHH